MRTQINENKIDFDAHIDTWNPESGRLGSEHSIRSQIHHGTFFHWAYREHLLGPSQHIGIRTRVTDLKDYRHDEEVGFNLISTDDIDDLGIPKIIEMTKQRVGDNPVYISFDIDVLDPSTAPATGTPESGGLTVREVRRILTGLDSLNIIGFDLVEVAVSIYLAAPFTTSNIL